MIKKNVAVWPWVVIWLLTCPFRLLAGPGDTARLHMLRASIMRMGCDDTVQKIKTINIYRQTAIELGDEEHKIIADMYLADMYLHCRNDHNGAARLYAYCAEHAYKAGAKKISAEAYIGMAEAYESGGDNVKAIESYMAAIDLSPDPSDLASVYANMGRIYNVMSDHPKALELYENAYATYYQHLAGPEHKDVQDTLGSMLLLINIADVHRSLGQYQQALDHYQQVQQLNRTVKNGEFNMYCLEGMGNCMWSEKKADLAISYLNGALLASTVLNDVGEECNILNDLGSIYIQQKNIFKASECANKALALEVPAVSKNISQAGFYLPDTYRLLGDICSMQKAYGHAVGYIEKAIGLYSQGSRQKEESEAWYALYLIHSELDRRALALRSYKRYIILRDSVFNQDRTREVTRIEMKSIFGRKHVADSILQAKREALARVELSRQKRDKQFFVAGSVLLLIIAIGAIYIVVYTRKAKRKIELLVKEMHHRVKNNLQIVSTLLDLQLADIHDDSVKKPIEEGITRIRSIALIHHHLYREDELSSIEISDFIKELHKEVSAIYLGRNRHATLINEVPRTWLDVDTSIPLGLILNELLTNSYKYAFGDASELVISVYLTCSHGKYVMRYRDHGPGLPDDLDIKNAESLGMRLISSLSAQLGGAFEYRKRDNSFYITFRDTHDRKQEE